LEARENMSGMAAGFGDGVWLNNNIGVTAAKNIAPRSAAEQVVLSSDRVVLSDHGSNGLWMYRNNAWAKISPNNAVSIDLASNGRVAASFSKIGTWLYTPAGGWKQADVRTAEDVEVYGVPGATGVLSDMGNAGVFESVMGARGLVSRRQVITGNAQQMVANDAGQTFLDYGSHGLYAWSRAGGMLRQVDDRDAVCLDVATNSVAATFAGEAGIYKRHGADPIGGDFEQVAQQTARRVKITDLGEVVADFGNGAGAGVWMLNTLTQQWKQLYSNSPVCFDVT
jgi:hypothetical protein